MPTVQSLCESAAQELNLIMAGKSLGANDGALILDRLNNIFEAWNLKREAIYRSVLTTYTLTPSLQPHTIGPTGTFTVAQRPTKIQAANLVVSGVHTTITVRDLEWRKRVSVPATTAAFPTDLYYDPTWPNGSIYLYGIPTTAYGLELQTLYQFAAVALSDTVTFPQGYKGALIDTLVEDIATPFGRTVPERITTRARQRRADIFAVNDVTPRLATVDAGMPGGCGGSWNNATGRME